MYPPDAQVIDCEFAVEGNTLVAYDVLSHGGLSNLKSRCGDYSSPEHAELMGHILSDPRLLVAAAEGRITQEIFDKAAELLRQRKAADVLHSAEDR